MKLAKRNSGADSKSLTGDVTADSYADRCSAFIQACGGRGFVIRAIEGPRGSDATGEPATEPQWMAWMDYFAAKGIGMRFTVSFGLRTVPSEWPEEFDYSWPASDRLARLPRPKPIDVARSEEIGRRLRALAASIDVPRPAHAKVYDPRTATPAAAAAHLRELQERFTSVPCAPLSGLAEREGAA